MYEDLRGKKLLIVGADMNDCEIVRAARSLGVYTIAMDWSVDYKKSPAKLIADEAWDMNYRDVKAVSARCKAENVDGVMAGYSEMRVLLAAEISDIIQKPFYVSKEIVEMTRSKRVFKQLCIEYGVPVPKEYSMNGTADDLSDIEYPVIVKPSDYGGRIGITVCYNSEELGKAVDKALSVSESKTIVVEEYVSGIEMCAVYNMKDGEIELALLNDKYQVIKDEKLTVLCNATVVPSSHLDLYMKTVDGHIKDFLRGIGGRNGMAFFQMIAGDNGIRVFEMGYRLNGGNDFHIIDRYNHINHMKMLISYSLTGSMGDDIKKNNPRFVEKTVTFLFYVHGGTVGEIKCDGLSDIPEIFAVTQKVFPGTVVPEDGTTRQEALVIKFSGSSFGEIKKTIEKAVACVTIRDENGNDMLFDSFDVDRFDENE